MRWTSSPGRGVWRGRRARLLGRSSSGVAPRRGDTKRPVEVALRQNSSTWWINIEANLGSISWAKRGLTWYSVASSAPRQAAMSPTSRQGSASAGTALSAGVAARSMASPISSSLP